MNFQFSGHETFPLRQLWLQKAFEHTHRHLTESNKRTSFFSGEDAMIELGVGKNMVVSLRFWANAVGIIRQGNNGKWIPTELGMLLLAKDGGLDPYSENPSTPWIVHWNLVSSPDRLSVFWYLFNHVNKPSVTRSELQAGLVELAGRHNFRISDSSIKRDVEVCLRSYLPMLSDRNKKLSEEFVEPLLGDLDIIRTSSRDVIELQRNARPTLHNALFAYALLDFWNKQSNRAATLDFNSIAYDIGSPGRVFKIDENSLVRRLETLGELTEGNMVWSEQAGIRTVIRTGDALNNPVDYMFHLIQLAYQ